MPFELDARPHASLKLRSMWKPYLPMLFWIRFSRCYRQVRRPRSVFYSKPKSGFRDAGAIVASILFLVFTRSATALPSENFATLLKTANSYHQQRNYSHSIPILKQLAQSNPQNYEVNLLLGEDLFHNGNIHDALAPLEAASKARPEDGTALAFLADAAVDLLDYSTASEALQLAVARSPGAEQVLVKWADYCLDRSRVLGQQMRTSKRGEATMLRVTAANRKDGDEVRESLLEQSAAQDPEQRGIWGELGSSQLVLGKHEEAAESLKEAQRREPEEAETQRLEALLAVLEQRWPNAESRLSALGARSPAELKRTLESWPRFLVPGPEVSGTVWDCLRNATSSCSLTSAKPSNSKDLSRRDLYEAGRWEQLVALPASATADSFDSLWRGVAFAKTDDCPHGIPLLERGVKADGSMAVFWLEVCYAGAGEDVLAHLRKAGDEVAVHELKGDMLLRLKNDGAAAQWEYAAALKSRPKDPHLLARLADAYDRVGDGVHAKETALEAVALEAHESLALRTLAQMAMSDRDYAEAIGRLKQLSAIDPADDWAKVQLGVAYGQTGHPEGTLRYLAPELAAGYPDKKGALHAMLASALRKLGREDEARLASAEASKLAKSSLESGETGSPDAH